MSRLPVRFALPALGALLLTVALAGGAAAQLQRITPEGYEAKIDLTLTDDFPWAQAIVIISGVPMISPVNEGESGQ